MRRKNRNSLQHLFKFILTAEVFPAKISQSADGANGNGFSRVAVTIKSQKSGKMQVYSKSQSV